MICMRVGKSAGRRVDRQSDKLILWTYVLTGDLSCRYAGMLKDEQTGGWMTLERAGGSVCEQEGRLAAGFPWDIRVSR